MEKRFGKIQLRKKTGFIQRCAIISATWLKNKVMRAFESLYMNRKRVLASILAFVMLITQLPHIVLAAECVGEHTYVNGICTTEGCGVYEPAVQSDNGTPIDTTDDYYAISNAGQLFWFSMQVNSGNVGINGKLTKSIDLNPGYTFNEDGSYSGGDSVRSWIPIGDETNAYSGTFDGNSKTVRGLYFYDNTKINVGLFGYVNMGTVKYVAVTNSYIEGLGNVSGICGNNSNGTIENCYNTGAVYGNDNVGGVCGNNDDNNSNIKRCYNTGTIMGNSVVGGVCGKNAGNIYNCYNIGLVNGNYNIGGVCGNNTFCITYCYNIGTVHGTSFVGGVCGDSINEYLYASYYLIGCADDASSTVQYGVGNANIGATTPDNGNAFRVSQDYFADGTVTDCLNVTQEFPYVWYQGNEYPLLFMYPEATLTNDTYEIASAEQLLWFALQVNAGNTINGKLTENIDLNPGYIFNEDGTYSGGDSPRLWTPIGTEINQYASTFDGNGKTVSGLYFNDEAKNYVGLFGIIGGTVKNVAVTNSYIHGHDFVGGVSGGNSGTIERCYNTGYVSGNDNVGGVSGDNSGTIERCYNTGYVSGNDNVGGVCGYNHDSTIEHCYNTGAVNGHDNIGGVCGSNDGSNSNVKRCYNTGTINGNNNVGGVCGYNSWSLTYCYNIGTVDGNVYVGGVCGNNSYYDIENCHYLTGCATDGNGTEQYGVGNEALGDVTYDAGNALSQLINYFTDGTVTNALNSTGFPYAWYQGNEYPLLIMFSPATLTDTVYEITTAEQLLWFAAQVNAGWTDINGRLTADIDLNPGYTFNADGSFSGGDSPHSWIPIGNDYEQYAGTFDGNNKTVSGMYFNDETKDYVGLFGCISTGIVKNVTVTNSYIKGHDNVGGICGLINNGIIEHCYNTGAVNGNDNVGGVCGKSTCTINSCYNTGTVSGVNFVGGVCGFSINSITCCYNTGMLSGDEYVGGVCGYNIGFITHCYNIGTADGNIYVGGVCGMNEGNDIKSCYNIGTIKGDYYVGGVCGDTMLEVDNCYYLTGCATDEADAEQNGIGNSAAAETTIDSAESTTGKSTTDFASGCVTYALNGNRSEGTAENPLVWYQNIDNDETHDTIPKFAGGTVYYVPSSNEYSNYLPVVYSVAITWGTMSFTYIDEYKGTWNSRTLSYDNPIPAAWICDTDANKITVTSSSSVDLSVSFGYTAVEGVAVSSSFTDGTNIITEALSLAVGTETPQVVVAYLTPSGKPDESSDDTVIGTVMITIDD